MEETLIGQSTTSNQRNWLQREEERVLQITTQQLAQTALNSPIIQNEEPIDQVYQVVDQILEEPSEEVENKGPDYKELEKEAIPLIDKIIKNCKSNLNNISMMTEKSTRNTIICKSIEKFVIDIIGKLYKNEELKPIVSIDKTIDANYFAGKITIACQYSHFWGLRSSVFYIEELNKNCSSCTIHHMNNISLLTSNIEEFKILMYFIKKLIYDVLGYTAILTTVSGESGGLFRSYHEDMKPLKTFVNQRNSHTINYYLEIKES